MGQETSSMMVFLLTTLVGSLICGLFLYGRSLAKNFYFIVVWWKTKDQKGKRKSGKVLFRDLCRFNECKDNPQTQLQVT